jgi:ABC-type sugar transport system substrate-binding protein
MTVMCTAMDSAIAKNPAGICVWGYDAALDSYIVKAQDAGIPVVTFVGSTTEHGDCYIGTSQYDLGYNGGKLYAESIGGQGEVAILTILGSDMFEERTQGFEDAFAEYPGVTVVAYGDTKADATIAISAAKDIAIKYPDLQGYVCTDSTGAQGAATALSELGLTGEVDVLGLDRNTETLQMVKDGTITGTLAQKRRFLRVLGVHHALYRQPCRYAADDGQRRGRREGCPELHLHLREPDHRGQRGLLSGGQRPVRDQRLQRKKQR